MGDFMKKRGVLQVGKTIFRFIRMRDFNGL